MMFRNLSKATPGHLLMIVLAFLAPTFTALATRVSAAGTVTSVKISPGSATIAPNAKITLTATVSGTTTNKAVTWHASLGTITSGGVYSTSSPGVHKIRATSVADTTKSAWVTITVTTAKATTGTVTSVTVTPDGASVAANAKLTLTATVAGTTTNKAVTWHASPGATITSAGVVSAPTAGTYVVRATSVVNTTKSDWVSVKVTAAPSGQTSGAVTSVVVSPDPATSITNGTLPFTAKVSGTATNKAVTWRASLGTISSSGLYKATATPGTHIITATSVADPSKSDSVSVKVIPETAPPPPTTPSDPPPASGMSAPLPPGFFGMTWNDVHASHVPTVSFGSMRLWDTKTKWADLEPSAGRYNWGTLDSWLETADTHGKDVLYTLGETPTWASMRPSEACNQDAAVHGCAAPPKDVDSGNNLWKTFVAALVHHSLASRTGHIKYYEIWDEPNAPNGIFWSGSQAQLAILARDAYEIIHQLDPEALVIGPSPTGGAFSSNWMKEYWAAGGAKYLDIIGDHGWTKPVNGIQNPQDLLAVIDSVHAAESSYGLPSKPIWFTEGNWGKNPGTNDDQIAFLSTEYIFLWSKGVSRFYWYAWDNTSNWGPLWDPSHGVHPAGTAYGLLYKWMVGSTHPANPCTENAESTWTCKLTLADGSKAEILWNHTASKTVNVGTTFHSYHTLDNTTVHAISGDTVTVGKKPILVVD